MGVFGSSETETRAYDEIRLLLRGWARRGLLPHAEPAGRQGVRAGGDDEPRDPGPAGIHGDDAGLGPLQPVRARVARRVAGPDAREPPAARERRGCPTGPSRPAAPCLPPIRRPRVA